MQNIERHFQIQNEFNTSIVLSTENSDMWNAVNRIYHQKYASYSWKK